MAGDEIFAGYRRHLAAKVGRPQVASGTHLSNRSVGGKNKIRRSAAGLTSRFLRGHPLTPAER
jgi:hypothetical protein